MFVGFQLTSYGRTDRTRKFLCSTWVKQWTRTAQPRPVTCSTWTLQPTFKWRVTSCTCECYVTMFYSLTRPSELFLFIFSSWSSVSTTGFWAEVQSCDSVVSALLRSDCPLLDVDADQMTSHSTCSSDSNNNNIEEWTLHCEDDRFRIQQENASESSIRNWNANVVCQKEIKGETICWLFIVGQFAKIYE